MASGNTTYIAEMPSSTESANSPSLIFDAVVRIAPSSTARLSKYTISDKSEITNHRVRNNPTLQLTCWMGRAPLQNYDNNLVGVENEDSRPQLTLDILNKWDTDGTELFIATEYNNYSQYVITKLDHDTEGTDAIKFNISLEKARRVTYSRGVLIQNMDGVKAIDAKGNDSSGTTDTKDENLYVTDDATALLLNYLKDNAGTSGDEVTTNGN